MMPETNDSNVGPFRKIQPSEKAWGGGILERLITCLTILKGVIGIVIE